MNNILSPKQFGFRRGNSTEDAIRCLMTIVYHSLNSNKKVSGLFIDFTKAFDLVRHDILLIKLEAAGVRGSALGWFSSYLTGRKQQVRINKSLSDEGSVNIGIPQGSVLSADLFAVFINDLLLLPFQGEVIAFADDIVFVYSADSWNEVRAFIDHDLILLKSWCDSNSMLVNAKKTKLLNFDLVGYTFQDQIKYHNCQNNLNCNCDLIEQVNEIKYLGILLDNKVTWKAHVNALNTELRKSIRSFYFLRNVCDSHFLRTLYFALIHSRLQYGIEFWGSAFDNLLNKLNVTQRYFIRIICFKRRRDHTDQLFKQLKILTIKNLFIFKVLRAFYRRSGNRGTENLFYQTRNVVNRHFIRPRVNKSFFSKTFLFLGPKSFNLLPQEIKNCNTFVSFSNKLKYWLFTAASIDVLLFALR